MPQFSPGEVKTARAPITVRPAGLSCTAELYLVSNGAKITTSGIKTFTSSGARQNISFPLTMPGATGTYSVYLDVFAQGMLIGAYKATEDVVIGAAVAEFAYVSAIRQTKYETAPGESWNRHYLRVEIDVKNTSSVAGTCVAEAQLACAQGDWAWTRFSSTVRSLVLQPGEIATFSGSGLDSPAYGYTCKVRFTGDPGTTPEVSMI